jgi:leucyl-tRNA synthetase
MIKNEAKKKESGIKKYDPSSIEPKWQSKWESEEVYQPDLSNAKRPFYNLMMFPYPSAEGLHIGSIFTFGGVDVYGRFKRMQGYDVFEPIGLDGFGIHSENHALKTGVHPMDHAKTTEENFYRQLHTTGISYAWKNKLETYDPNYYKWTQWLFTELFKAGLAYKKESPVNFCPSCKTVLADEQVIDGKCERCDSVVEKRNLKQWFFRITSYADRLLENIETLDWSDRVRIAQRNWIGKKEGINITYRIEESQEKIIVFTTRPDTNFGATFIALAPEHPLALKITTPDKKEEVQAYIKQATKKSEIERASEGKEKTGVFTGAYAINQLTGYRMPIWISDFVLAGFGTGALVGVPGHDKRDFEFARKFKLNVKRVVVGRDGDQSIIKDIEQVQAEAGTMINSEFLNGMDINEATDRIMGYMEEKGYGEKVATYHLRDWLISRQRYWGPPIPMIFCESCAKTGKSWFTSEAGKSHVSNKKNETSATEAVGWYPVEQKDLPVELPYVKDYKPLGTGKSPLGSYPDFYETKCPHCGSEATRETDVSDTFLDSAWYFLRYLATDWKDVPFPMKGSEAQKFKGTKETKEEVENRMRYLPVTMYIGGTEHSVLHLLYSRFTTMVLHDLGYVDFEEPFSRFYAHGLIIKDGAKMSKSKGNVINPDVYIKKFGADAVRCYLLFLGPFNQGGDFQDTAMEGMFRFIKRVWALFIGQSILGEQVADSARKMLHETIKGVTEDLEELRYNTALAKLMTHYNFLSKQKTISKEEAEVFLKLFAPFAPHITEELWQTMGNNFSIHTSAWPSYEAKFIQEDRVKIPVQVNGKHRGTLEVASETISDKELIEKMAKKDKGVAKFLEGKTVRQIIYVPGKVLNFVASE